MIDRQQLERLQMQTIIAAIAADPNIDPTFAGAIRPLTAREKAASARAVYYHECAVAKREVDPIMADLVCQRALADAEGRQLYHGD